MTQEEKQLLLKDLCTRLPYGVVVRHECEDEGKIHYTDGPLVQDNKDGWDIITTISCGIVKYGMKPYLRPMSSMTEEEFENLKEYSELKYDQLDLASFQNGAYKCLDFYLNEVPSDAVIRVFDWLNKYHFDYRDLIQMGLAIAVTKENNPY